ncbi:MAG TPA: hypothetical protein PKW45_06390 [Bryobacteraceae bacterium]|nr:hypothetical protein [Bryobacteraceae bacterium]
MPRGAKNVDTNLLAAALEGLEAQKRRIEEQIDQVQALLGRRRGRTQTTTTTTARETGGKRQLSPAARRRIAAAQKRRWAEYRKRTAAQKQK